MNKILKNVLIVIAVPTVYAILARLVYGVKTEDDLFQVMSISFLFCVPTVVGAMTVYFSDVEKIKSLWYRIFKPWVPIIFFMMFTLLINIEGWACWIMVLPLFFLAASIGGLLGAYFKLNKRNDKLNISIMLLFPLLVTPFEKLLDESATSFEAYTYIDIEADAAKIWDLVTRVEEIKEEEDTGWLNKFLGFPRPVRAELDFEGVGAYREAIFTNGLVFHETVTEYEDNKKMVFDIKAYPHEIPSTTLDEHVVIGGKYFDVLHGTYELEDLGRGIHRLHLSSVFEMKTTFNFYAGWWGKWIMKDIQNNILKVEKKRAER